MAIHVPATGGLSTLDVPTCADAVDKLETWVKLVDEKLLLPKGCIDNYSVELEKDEDCLIGIIKFNGKLLAHSTYDNATKKITFKQREEMELCWHSYVKWYHFQKEFLQEIQKFW